MVTFSPGKTSASFKININDDKIFERNETFNLSISAALPSGITSGDPNQATVVIMDDNDSKYLVFLLYTHSNIAMS